MLGPMCTLHEVRGSPGRGKSPAPRCEIAVQVCVYNIQAASAVDREFFIYKNTVKYGPRAVGTLAGRFFSLKIRSEGCRHPRGAFFS